MKNIQNEVMEAYCDCRLPWEEAVNRRNLNFRASGPISVLDAVRIMRKAVPNYNAFNPDLLTYLPTGARVTIARENSVCLYVTPVLREIVEMDADEWHNEGNETRIWWD